ncbi:hypothetical protein OAO87_01945, partial [bacterium]|nr:hypothetical protein [bacterium]
MARAPARLDVLHGMVLRQIALLLALVQRTKPVDTSRMRPVRDDAVLLVARRLDGRVAEEDANRELRRVHGTWPAAKARPAALHVRRVVGDGEEDGREDIMREAALDARVACLRVDRLARVPLGERRRGEHKLLDLPIVHVVLAEAKQRHAAIGPDVAGHRRLDALRTQRCVDSAELLPALAREQQHVLHHTLVIWRNVRTLHRHVPH